jgi:uncharacterized membrane protein YbhN (UPF0104 family)
MRRLSSVHIVLAALVTGSMLSLLASRAPDGLEKVAHNAGLLDHAGVSFHALLSNYAVPAVAYGPLSHSIAGIVGTLLVFVVLYALGYGLVRSKH